MDGSSNDNGSRATLVLSSPGLERVQVEYALRLKFKASNNKAEYEALLAGLRLARVVRGKHLNIFSDSQLIVKQVSQEHQAKGRRTVTYLTKVRDHLTKFETWRIQQIPGAQNAEADSLAKLASVLSSELSRTIPVECLNAQSIQDQELLPLDVELAKGWQTLIIRYLQNGIEPSSKEEAKKLGYKASHYVLVKGILYKCDHFLPLLQCLDREEANYVMREIHEGVCGNYSAGRSLAHKVLRQGYYWPSLAHDAAQLYKRCDCYQRFANDSH